MGLNFLVIVKFLLRILLLLIVSPYITVFYFLLFSQALKAIEKLIESGRYKIKPVMMEIVISLDPKIVEVVSPKILLHVHHITRQGLNSEGIFEMVSSRMLVFFVLY